MDTFTPLPALGGGILIGLSAALLLVGIGRIAGISGILDSAMTPARAEIGWQAAFLVGLLASVPLLVLAGFELPAIRIEATLPVVALAGLLVGFGTRLGSGCTSGHGVCGLARGSARSLSATLTFMGFAVLTVFVLRHGLGA